MSQLAGVDNKWRISEFHLVALVSVSWLTETLEQNRAIVNIISNTCAFSCLTSKNVCYYLSNSLCAYLSVSQFLVRSSSQDVSLTLPFTVPTVTSVTSLLRQGEGRIANPHHVILVLGALQSVPLDHLTPLIYQSAFLAVHEALFAIIQCHPQVCGDGGNRWGTKLGFYLCSNNIKSF